SMMNAIHDLPLLVARDAGFFRDEGLDVEIVKTPGTGQRGADHQALRDNIFTRTMENLYEQGACDQFRMCEWGIMKRAVESNVESGHRPAKIVALGSAMSTFAIVVDPKSRIYEPEQLKNRPIAVSPFNGSHFTMLKMLEGFLNRDQIKWVNSGTHEERVKALRSGKIAAVSLMEAWVSVAEKDGLGVIIESRFTPRGAGGEGLGGRCPARRARPRRRSRRTPASTRTTWWRKRAACWSSRTCGFRAFSTRRRSPIRASGSSTPTTGRSAGTWFPPAPPTRTRSTI